MGSGLFAIGWHSMLALNLPILEKIVRPILVYVFLLIALRVAGKRELAQLNPFDLVVLLMLSNTVQNAIIGDDNSVTGGLLGAAALLIMNYVAVRFFFFNRRIQTKVIGAPTPLIEGGQPQKDNLRRQLITRQELILAAQRQGFDTLEEVDRAVLEPGGFISFKHKERSAADERHSEVMDEIQALQATVSELKDFIESLQARKESGTPPSPEAS